MGIMRPVARVGAQRGTHRGDPERAKMPYTYLVDPKSSLALLTNTNVFVKSGLCLTTPPSLKESNNNRGPEESARQARSKAASRRRRKLRVRKAREGRERSTGGGDNNTRPTAG